MPAPKPSAAASAGQLRRDAPRRGDHEAGERRRADGVRVEGEPAQHDPGPEHARRARPAAASSSERALHVGRRRGSARERARRARLPTAPRRSPRCWRGSSPRRWRRSTPRARASPPTAGGRRAAPVSCAIASSTLALTERSAKIARTRSRRIVSTSFARSPADACACVESDGITVPTTREAVAAGVVAERVVRRHERALGPRDLRRGSARTAVSSARSRRTERRAPAA